MVPGSLDGQKRSKTKSNNKSPDDPRMIPGWSKQSRKKVPGWSPGDPWMVKQKSKNPRMVPGWSLDGQTKVETKSNKNRKKTPRMIPGWPTDLLVRPEGRIRVLQQEVWGITYELCVWWPFMRRYTYGYVAEKKQPIGQVFFRADLFLACFRLFGFRKLFVMEILRETLFVDVFGTSCNL